MFFLWLILYKGCCHYGLGLGKNGLMVGFLGWISKSLSHDFSSYFQLQVLGLFHLFFFSVSSVSDINSCHRWYKTVPTGNSHLKNVFRIIHLLPVRSALLWSPILLSQGKLRVIGIHIVQQLSVFKGEGSQYQLHITLIVLILQNRNAAFQAAFY